MLAGTIPIRRRLAPGRCRGDRIITPGGTYIVEFPAGFWSFAAKTRPGDSHQQGVAALSVQFGGLRMIGLFWLQPADLPRLIRLPHWQAAPICGSNINDDLEISTRT